MCAPCRPAALLLPFCFAFDSTAHPTQLQRRERRLREAQRRREQAAAAAAAAAGQAAGAAGAAAAGAAAAGGAAAGAAAPAAAGVAAAAAGGPADLDFGSLLATFPPDVREEVLLRCGVVQRCACRAVLCAVRAGTAAHKWLACEAAGGRDFQQAVCSCSTLTVTLHQAQLLHMQNLQSIRPSLQC